MTDKLIQKSCKPCEGGVLPLDGSKINDYQSQINKRWQVQEKTYLITKSEFEDFQAALDFVNQVGELAEQENHHPDIHITDYKNVKVVLTTHAIGGLSENDFILAAKIDQLFND